MAPPDLYMHVCLSVTSVALTHYCCYRRLKALLQHLARCPATEAPVRESPPLPACSCHQGRIVEEGESPTPSPLHCLGELSTEADAVGGKIVWCGDCGLQVRTGGWGANIPVQQMRVMQSDSMLSVRVLQ